MQHALADVPYEEILSHRATFSNVKAIAGWSALGFSGDDVLQVVSRKSGGAILRTSTALWASDATGSAWRQLATSFRGVEAVLLDGSADAVVLADGVYLFECSANAAACKETKVSTLQDAACARSITSAWWNSSGDDDIGIGCATGLYLGKADAANPPSLKPVEWSVERAADGPVLATASWGSYIAAATAQRVHWRRPDGAWWWEWVSAGQKAACSHSVRDYAGGAVEGVPRALTFDAGYGASGGLLLAHEHGLQLLDLATGALERVAPVPDGLPVANLTSAAVVPGSAPADAAGVWLGTANGLARRMPADAATNGLGGGGTAAAGSPATAGPWRYYAGRRWLPGRRVRSVVPLSRGRLLVLSDEGVAVLEAQEWTLARKAHYYQSLISPRHARYGYVCDCGLRTPGNLTDYYHMDSDNDGLWTSMYTASQAFRYASSGEAAARDEAVVRFRALRFLFEAPASGGTQQARQQTRQQARPQARQQARPQTPRPPHFPARSAARVGDRIYSGGTWHNSTAFPGWVWKCDTSSDELTGHMFVYPILHRLGVLPPDAAEAAQLPDLVEGLVGGLLAHNLSLIDPSTNAPTSWGKFGPHWLNEVRGWSDDRGLRALEMLSYLAGAEAVTRHPKYAAAAHTLRATHGYGRMMVNAKITDPCDDNHSDDEEAFLPLYTYLTAYGDLQRPRDAEFNATLERLCRITRRESDALYLAVCALASGTSAPTALAVNLRGWPLELITWDTRNSLRDDLRHKAPPFGDQAASAVPARDAERLRWNANPYEMDAGDGGKREGDPAAFLLAYWMARYHGLLAAPA